MAAKIPLPDFDNLVRRYLAGESPNQLAREFGINRVTLVRRMKQGGVQLRGRSEAESVKWARYREDPGAYQQTVLRQCHDAWAATRGVPQPWERKVARARTRYERLRFVHRGEAEVAEVLRLRGVRVEQQFPVGAYNLDLAVPERRVSVEVVGSRWRPPSGTVEKVHKRTKYLIDAGWWVYFVFLWHRESAYARRGYSRPTRVRPFLSLHDVADKLVAFLEVAGRDQAGPGKYGVVAGNGQPVPFAGAHLKDLPRVEGF